MEPDFAHHSIHEECSARHVAGIFEQPDEEKEDQDLRKKNDDATHARQHTVCEQIA